MKHGDFIPSMLNVPHKVKPMLTAVHWELLTDKFEMILYEKIHMLMMAKKPLSSELHVGSALGTNIMCQKKSSTLHDATEFIGIMNIAFCVWVKQMNHCRNICTYAYCVLGITEFRIFIRSRVRETEIH